MPSTGLSLLFVKVSSTEMKRGEKIGIVRVKLYETDSPPPVTLFSNSNFDCVERTALIT
jgi:hypothetical protein